MKHVFCILLVWPLVLFGQDTTSQRKLLGISLCNDLTYRVSRSDDHMKVFQNEFDSLETSAYGFTAGIHCGVFLRPDRFIQSGLYFTRMGYGIDTLEEAGLERIRYVYDYLEIPVHYCHVFRMQRKFQPIVSCGLQAGYLMSHSETYYRFGEAQPQRIKVMDDLLRFNLSIVASLGIQRNIASDYRIRIEARYRQSITPVSDSPLRRYLFSTGINVSLSRTF